MKKDNTNSNIHAIVTIPQLCRDETVGNALDHVCQIMFQTENTTITKGNYIEWDFKLSLIPHPFLLGTLAILKVMYGESVNLINVPKRIDDFFNTVFFHSPLKVTTDSYLDSIWEIFKDKTYIPICEFNPYDESSIVVQKLVQTIIKEQIKGKSQIHNVLSYLFSELIDNITDHSHSDKGFIFCQRIPRLNMLYVFIADIGRSIYSSYATDNRYADKLSMNESSAFLLALKGMSTKNRPESENRGYGISKSRELIVNGLGGEFYILSGSAFARHDENGEIVADLPQDLRWNGTIILLKIPNNLKKEINIYDYIS